MASPNQNQRAQSFFGRALGAFRAAESHATVWYAFIAALLAIVVAYRIELAAVIYGHGSQMTRLQSAAVPPVKFIGATINDLVFVCVIGVSYLLVKMPVMRWLPRLANHLVFKVLEGLFAIGLLLALALIERTHFQLMVQLDTGLTRDFLVTVPELIEPGDFYHMLSGSDVVFIILPMVVFTLAGLVPRFMQRLTKGVFVALSVVALGALPAGQQGLSPEVSANPVIYLATDTVDDWLNEWIHGKAYYAQIKDLPGRAQMNSIRLVDPIFVDPRPAGPAPKTQPAMTDVDKSWNILFFVLESTGSDYIFDTSLTNEPPMPFLKKMSEEGLFLTNHFTAANNTAKAAFSLFTGIYPATGWKIFAMEEEASIPTLNRYLPLDYDFFLIHPAPVDVSFPPRLFLNNGLKDFYNMDNMPPDRHPAPNGMARNELDSVDFLLSRLDHATEPFLGVYWSFVPHYPYADYGPEFRILPGKTKREAYYNNLRLLDTQLQRVYEHLKEIGLLDRTVFVIVGDHGEAFGQHPGVWAHTFGFNSEMFRAPMLFWQPKLIAPQKISFPTSHVDVVPTLLDILGFKYDPSRFQGESVLRGTPRRKYIFTMDARSEYISAINPQLLKIIVGFHQNYLGAYNLAKDPGEKLPLDEKGLAPEVNAVIKFRNYQALMLKNYNQAIADHRRFPADGSESTDPADDAGSN